MTGRRTFFDDEFAADMQNKRASQPIALSASEVKAVREKCETLCLNALEYSPLTTRELVEIAGHRFSTGIRNLVKRGYIIEKERLTDSMGFRYILSGRRDGVEVTDDLKQAYYKTRHWFDKRRQRIEFDEVQCVRCKRGRVMGDPFEVHHWQYDLFNEVIGDLMTVCSECHVWIHSLPSVKIAFPPFVSHKIADRIKRGVRQ